MLKTGLPRSSGETRGGSPGEKGTEGVGEAGEETAGGEVLKGWEAKDIGGITWLSVKATWVLSFYNLGNTIIVF